MAYPSEYVIRIFKGTYPHLDLAKNKFTNKKICDIGAGDGRNLVLLKQRGFEAYGVEINSEIVRKIKQNLKRAGVRADIRVGRNDSIPFSSSYFDYLLSWNACYYMGDYDDFNDYVKEFARVIKPKGCLVMSIPKKTSFIYKGSETIKKGYRVIRNDPYKIRNGYVLRMFAGEKEIEKTFSPYFKNFTFGSIQDDCFGLNYHWHLVVCQRK
ncbi:MAG: class I SAM-dependent methyltransferase [Candidatus Wildermuthbacteria bacterium]|nr:class I SAM-dependent methyltransferase [Candidatus Wildermuthbacteria bacterium]